MTTQSGIVKTLIRLHAIGSAVLYTVEINLILEKVGIIMCG